MIDRVPRDGAHAPSSRSSRLVLVVEDDEDMGEAVAYLFRELGHRVLLASSGMHANELLEHARPHLALLDLGLPDEDGCSIAIAMRARFGTDVRLVALTGYTGSEMREKARMAGFDAFLRKPVTCAELEEQVLSAR
jgi:CheY-like chemotaxis protein